MTTSPTYEGATLQSAQLSLGGARVLSVLEKAGAQAWVVGGWVRDALLQRPSQDIDIATSFPWERTLQALQAAHIGAKPTGAAHGTVTAFCAGEAVEVTTYRVDGPYLDGRHPTSVEFVDDVERDLARRDFTINALAWHPERGLLDPFGGKQDIARQLVRAVGDPFARFNEDALRILRAVRFAARLRFTIEETTQQAVRELASTLDRIAAERIGQELRGILAAGRGGWPLRKEREALFAAIPELAPMDGFEQRSRYHSLNVFDHVCRVMDYTEVFAGGVATEELRWCALLHDIGKPRTLWVDDRGNGHFYGHPAEGMAMAQKILRRLAIPAHVRRPTLALVRLHDRAVLPTKASVLSILADLNELDPTHVPRLIRELMVIKRADAMAKAPAYRDYALEVDELDALAQELLGANVPYRTKDLAVSGNDLVQACQKAPGPWVGELLKALLKQVMEGELPNEREALLSWARKTAFKES